MSMKPFFLKQIENKQPVQTSFRCVSDEIAVSFSEAASKFQFGMYKCIQSEMCAYGRIFHLKDRRLKRGQAWFKAETETETTAEQLGCFLRFAGVKVGP